MDKVKKQLKNVILTELNQKEFNILKNFEASHPNIANIYLKVFQRFAELGIENKESFLINYEVNELKNFEDKKLIYLTNAIHKGFEVVLVQYNDKIYFVNNVTLFFRLKNYPKGIKFSINFISKELTIY